MSKYSLPKNKELKIGEKAAHDALMLWLNYYDIDIDAIEDKNTMKSAETILNKIVKFIRLGKIHIKLENGIVITQLLESKQTLEYKGIGAENKIAMDGYEDKDHYKRIYALLGSISGSGEAAILKLKEIDMSVAECIGFVFSQV